MEFLTDQRLLLSKIVIGKKIKSLLGQVELELFSVISEYSWPDGVLTKSGKISKGENYQGLPYYILDFPRMFRADNVFAFRTMCWWGNFFSGTLHLGGEYLDMHRSSLIESIPEIKSSKVFIGISSSPWEYHYGRDNYQAAAKLPADQLRQLFDSKSFVKLSYRWELHQYPDISQLAVAGFEETLSWIVKSDKR